MVLNPFFFFEFSKLYRRNKYRKSLCGQFIALSPRSNELYHNKTSRKRKQAHLNYGKPVTLRHYSKFCRTLYRLIQHVILQCRPPTEIITLNTEDKAHSTTHCIYLFFSLSQEQKLSKLWRRPRRVVQRPNLIYWRAKWQDAI